MSKEAFKLTIPTGFGWADIEKEFPNEFSFKASERDFWLMNEKTKAGEFNINLEEIFHTQFQGKKNMDLLPICEESFPNAITSIFIILSLKKAGAKLRGGFFLTGSVDDMENFGVIQIFYKQFSNNPEIAVCSMSYKDIYERTDMGYSVGAILY